MDKKSEDYFYLTGLCFKKVTIRKRVINILQLVADFVLGYEIMFCVSISRHMKFAWMIILAVLAKIILHLIHRDSIYNFIGIALTTLLIVMSCSLGYGFPIASIAAYLVHILRIKSCYVDARIKKVYGYPDFNYSFMHNELSKDEMMAASVRRNYNELLADPVIRFSAAESRTPAKIQVIRIAAAVMTGIALLMMYFGAKNMREYNNSTEVTSLDNCTIGMNITGTVHELYDNAVIAVSKSANDEYWGVFGDRLVLFSVPETYKGAFAELYNIYTKEYGLAERFMEWENVNVSREEGVNFHGKLIAAEDYDGKIAAPDLSKNCIDAPAADTTFYIKVIDDASALSTIHKGAFLFFLGLLLSCAAYVMIYRKLDELTGFGDVVF